MFDRRMFLQLGAAGAAAALVNAAEPAQGGARSRNASSSPHRAVFDPRFAEARAFAGELRSQGVALSEVSGDLGSLWYGDLQSQLVRSRAPVAGLTDRATLFCLEELTRSLGMRVRWRVDHHIGSNGSVRHDAAGPESVAGAARKLSSAGYGRAMASLAQELDPRESRMASPQKRTGPFSPAETTVLVSWVIA